MSDLDSAKGKEYFKGCRICKCGREKYKLQYVLVDDEIRILDEEWDFECGNYVVIKHAGEEPTKEHWEDRDCRNAVKVALESVQKLKELERKDQ